MPTKSPAPGIRASQKIDRSRKAVKAFLARQAEWIAKAEDAYGKSYYLETIGITTHQLHSLLRMGLWLIAQEQSLERQPDVWKDTYLFDLLLESCSTQMEGARDRELYGAAQRFGVISEDTSEWLQQLYVDAIRIPRSLVGCVGDIDEMPLRETAKELLAIDIRCLEALEKKFEEFDQKITMMIRQIESVQTEKRPRASR